METNDKKLALVNPDDLSLVDENSLNPQQLKLLLTRTPQQYIRQRPAKGGGVWNYVTGGYFKKVLNLMFGWRWSFEIVNSKIEHGEVVVCGKLICTTHDGFNIVKMQYGNKEIVYKKGTEKPLSIGNDYKAAATDALKKCSSELGICADVYNGDEFREVNVNTDEKEKEFDNILND